MLEKGPQKLKKFKKFEKVHRISKKVHRFGEEFHVFANNLCQSAVCKLRPTRFFFGLKHLEKNNHGPGVCKIRTNWCLRRRIGITNACRCYLGFAYLSYRETVIDLAFSSLVFFLLGQNSLMFHQFLWVFYRVFFFFQPFILSFFFKTFLYFPIHVVHSHIQVEHSPDIK